MARSDRVGNLRGQSVVPHIISGGYARPTPGIAIESVLTTTPKGRQIATIAGMDRHRIANLCQSRTLSLAEIASYMRLPLEVARAMVSDMVRDGLLVLHEPGSTRDPLQWLELLEEIVQGLRKL